MKTTPIVPSTDTTQTTTVPRTSPLFTTTPIETINILPKSTLIQTEPEIKTTKIINPKTTIIIKKQQQQQPDDDLTFNHQSLSSNYDMIKTQKCYVSKNNFTKLFLADYSADVDGLLKISCTSLNNNNSPGITFYKCHSDGLFYFYNSTCVSNNEQSSTVNLNLEVCFIFKFY